ncbi:MAG: SprT-like domain-containing protein [Cytophagaceae bacterium]
MGKDKKAAGGQTAKKKKILHNSTAVASISYLNKESFKVPLRVQPTKTITVENRFVSLLEKHLPQGSVSYCYKVWYENPFHFRLTRRRETKLGDYRFDPKTKSHTITLNHDLNPYSFLITYLHEVAHLKAQIRYGDRVKPHGPEWKAIFASLLLPLFEKKVIPASIIKPLKEYTENPKASSCADTNLMMALREFDDDGLIYLSEIKMGHKFRLGRKVFIKEKINRTRAVCREIKSGSKYLVSEVALVEKIDL